jgi:hypothetical protein
MIMTDESFRKNYAPADSDARAIWDDPIDAIIIPKELEE